VPLDIGGTRVSRNTRQGVSSVPARVGLPPSAAPVVVRFLQLAEVEEDFRSLLGVDLQSVSPRTSMEESAVLFRRQRFQLQGPMGLRVVHGRWRLVF